MNDEIATVIREMYILQGLSKEAIARYFEISVEQLEQVMRYHKIPLNLKRPYRKSFYYEAIALYKSGMQLREICTKYNIKHGMLHYLLKESGLKLRRSGPKSILDSEPPELIEKIKNYLSQGKNYAFIKKDLRVGYNVLKRIINKYNLEQHGAKK